MEPILSNVPGTLPWHVWHERHPALLAKIKGAHPFPPHVRTAIDDLLDETLTGAIRPVPDWYDEFAGRPWLDVPFLWAESVFYRRLLDAVGYFTVDGPWAGVDPFAFLKDADLASAPLADLPELAPPEQLLASLWGNQADLSFQIGVAAVSGGPVGPVPGPALAPASAVSQARLVADETDTALSVLAGARHVGLVADNAGQELLADLGLVDQLLSAGGVAAVTIFVKPHPYYVSDATTSDLVKCLQAMAAAGGRAAEIVGRLRTAAATGRLIVATHPFFCAPLPYHEAPTDLFGPADVLVFKGDLNYRRLVGDAWWPPSTPFASTVPSFGAAAVVALRTLKSDVLVGVDDATIAALDASDDEDWRVNGRYGSVQVLIG